MVHISHDFWKIVVARDSGGRHKAMTSDSSRVYASTIAIIYFSLLIPILRLGGDREIVQKNADHWIAVARRLR